jgi:hypothetical protein
MIAESLISQIQIALIGIVVVLGLFFVWRILHRLEDKVDRMLESLSSRPATCLPGSNTCAFGDAIPMPEDADAAEEFMRSVFGGGPLFRMETEAEPAAPANEGVVIEELPPATATVLEEAERASEADTDATTNPLSRSKLKKMNADTLKELCRERGLSTEGSKAVLTDRLLGLIRD